MKTFKTVEEYLEVIQGIRDITTGLISPTYFYSAKPIINLARYDVQVVSSMTSATTSNKALTERQGELAVKIVLKYNKQLLALGVDVAPIQDNGPTWRVPLRTMDYTHSLSIIDDAIIVKFPYKNELIEELRTFRKDSQGEVKFLNDKKAWKIALTEYNLNWCYAWAKSHNFTIAQEATDLMKLISEAEAEPYAIELVLTNAGLEITNCTYGLREYVTETVGEISLDNLLPLVNISGQCGFTVEQPLIDAIALQYGSTFADIASNREVKILPQAESYNNALLEVMDYADTVKKWPVVVYEPNLSNELLKLLKSRYNDDEVLAITKGNKAGNIPDSIKYIHITKPIRDMKHIPLLLTSLGMMIGTEKQILVQQADKIVYLASDVYKGTVIETVKTIAS